MRSRAEVLQEFGAAWNTSGEQAMADHIAAVEHQRDEYHRLWKAAVLEKRELSDRLRELEAQLVSNPYTLAASEPVAWAIVNRDGVTMDVRMTVTESREHSIGGDTLRPLVFADHPTTPTRGSDE